MKEKINKAWVMYTIENKGITQYNIFTKAGNYRWGKIYHADKYALILSGSCEMTLEENRKDNTRILTPESGIIKIPSWTPNIFYFPKDCHMLEWFQSWCEIEKFERYTDMKS